MSKIPISNISYVMIADWVISCIGGFFRHLFAIILNNSGGKCFISPFIDEIRLIFLLA